MAAALTSSHACLGWTELHNNGHQKNSGNNVEVADAVHATSPTAYLVKMANFVLHIWLPKQQNPTECL